MESQPKGGVQLTLWAGLKGREIELTAFRPIFAPSADVHHRAAFVLGRGYNSLFDLHKHLFDFEESEQPFFCSEVLDQFFSREELGLPRSGSIYPDDLLILTDDPRWVNVSSIYIDAIRSSSLTDETPLLDGIKSMGEASLVGIDLGLGRIEFDHPELFEARADVWFAQIQASVDNAVLETNRLMKTQVRRRRWLARMRSLAFGAIFRGR